MKNPIKLVALFVLACMLGVGIAAMLPAAVSAGDIDCVPVTLFYVCLEDVKPCMNPPFVWKRWSCEGRVHGDEEPCNCTYLGCGISCYQT